MAQKHAPRGPVKAKDDADLMDGSDLMNGRPRCTAKAKQSGKRCKRTPIPGGTVCKIHGGGAPQVQQAAMARLLALQHPAIDKLTQLIAQSEFPTVAYAAVRDVLDRTMGKPMESVALQHSGAIIVEWGGK
jgi:hypothetical protein